MKKIIYISSILVMLTLPLMGSVETNFFPVHHEIDHVSIIRIFAIDKGIEDPNNVKITVVGQLEGNEASSSENNGEEPQQGQAFIFSREDKTITGAIRALQSYSNKTLFWGHIDICLISEDAAKDDVQRYLDFLTCEKNFRLNSSIYITKSSAFEFLTSCNSSQYYIPNYINNLSKTMVQTSKNYDLKLLKLASELSRDEKPAVLIPTISSGDAGDNSEGRQLESTPPLTISGYDVMKDYKFVGVVDDKDMRGYNFIAGEIKNPIIQITDSDNCTFAMEVTTGNSRIIPRFQNKQLVGATIEMDFHSSIAEETSQNTKMSESKVYELQSLQSEVIKKEVLAIINYGKEYNADFWGLAQVLHHKYPIEWADSIKDNYDSIFPTLDIEVVVSSTIDRTYDVEEP